MPIPRHLRLPDSDPEMRAIRLIAASLAGVLLLGGAAVFVGASPLTSSPRPAAVRLSAEVAPSPLPLAIQPVSPAVKVKPVSRRTAKHVVRPKRAPAKRASARKSAGMATGKATVRPARWLPTGTGMWLHEFGKSEHGNGRAVVARAKRAGLTTLYVQTGSSKKGWIGNPVLSSVLPATKGTGIKVIAWDFPKLENPEADAMRMARAAKYHCGGCPNVAAVAPDVETAAEGTRISEATVSRYYTRLRRALPPEIAILATVPWPSEKRRGRYPYARTASLSDAILPMAYWYNRSPAVVTATSMGYLKGFGKPVMPVGQGYDGRIDAPYLKADADPAGSVRAFLRTANRRGAQHVSLWSWQTTGGRQWGALAKGEGMFRPKAGHGAKR